MRNFLFGVLITVFLMFGIKYLFTQQESPKTELESSDLILNQIKNVGKLIVTEGHFSEVITYKDAKKFYLDILTAKKKAIVVVNASVNISYDLSKIEYTIDKEAKTVIISEVPNPEININPDIKYHDLEQDFLNQFTPEDHNLIRLKVVEQLTSKVRNSSLIKNSKNRLISELQNIYILTSSLGWTLVYQDISITDSKSIEELSL